MAIRLVIADDHAVFRSGLKVLLEQEPDMEVIDETGTGWDTLRAVEEQDLDVLVLDLSMPGLPGSEVAEAALRKKPHLAIVVLTMHEEERYVQELLRIGARAFVFKKSTGRELLQAIRTAHKGQRYIDPSLVEQAISSYAGIVPEARKKTGLDLLTPREKDICRLLALGHTNAEIADRLSISARTVQTHRRNIMTKLGIKGRAELVSFAIENKLFPPPP